MTEPKVTVVDVNDDLDKLCQQINSAHWDEANDLCDYDAASLAYYLRQADTLFLACHESSTGKLMGIASGRILPKPYEKSRWLYVDEVDTAADQRKRGAGRAIMQAFLEIAQSEACDEVWLGTEPDNEPANALYQSLKPSEIESFVGYTWEKE